MQYQNLYHNQCCTLQRYQLSVAIFCVRWHGLNELKIKRKMASYGEGITENHYGERTDVI